MDDIGNIIFYIILAIIGLAGSFTGKKKKSAGPVRKDKPQARPSQGTIQRQAQRPAERPARQTVQEARPVDRPVRAPQYQGIDPRMEGRYGEPMADVFSSEGNYGEPLAGKYAREGSMADDLAASFSKEGNIEETMAAAFAYEGISAMKDTSIGLSDNTIADGEIADAERFDYEARTDEVDLSSGFDVRKAVIYSAVINRKEYTT